MTDLDENDKEIEKLNLLVQIDRAKAKVNEFRKFSLEYRHKAKQAEDNIPIQEQFVKELEEKLKQLN